MPYCSTHSIASNRTFYTMKPMRFSMCLLAATCLLPTHSHASRTTDHISFGGVQTRVSMMVSKTILGISTITKGVSTCMVCTLVATLQTKTAGI